jgi:hypothetical protein
VSELDAANGQSKHSAVGHALSSWLVRAISFWLACLLEPKGQENTKKVMDT